MISLINWGVDVGLRPGRTARRSVDQYYKCPECGRRGVLRDQVGRDDTRSEDECFDRDRECGDVEGRFRCREQTPQDHRGTDGRNDRDQSHRSGLRAQLPGRDAQCEQCGDLDEEGDYVVGVDVVGHVGILC